MASESQRKASAKYDKDHTVTVTVKLNQGTDADIIAWLSRKQNKQGAIKDLIRLQIERESQMLP